jgi:hypothetical protein
LYKYPSPSSNFLIGPKKKVHLLHGWVDKPKQVLMFRDLGEEGELAECPTGKIPQLTYSISQ